MFFSQRRNEKKVEAQNAKDYNFLFFLTLLFSFLHNQVGKNKICLSPETKIFLEIKDVVVRFDKNL